jgi:hypothetical protein
VESASAVLFRRKKSRTRRRRWGCSAAALAPKRRWEKGGPTAATWWEKELGSGDMVEAMGDQLRQHTGTAEVGAGWAVRVEESGAADRWALQLQCGAAMKLDQSKTDLRVVKKFEIKYGYEGFEERNNFLHQNLFRFEMDFN